MLAVLIVYELETVVVVPPPWEANAPMELFLCRCCGWNLYGVWVRFVYAWT